MENKESWKDIVAAQINKIIKDAGVKNLDFRLSTRYTIATLWGLIIFALFIIVFGVTIQFMKVAGQYLPLWLSIILIALGILILPVCTILIIKGIRQQNIENIILSKLDLGYVYKLAFDEIIGNECHFISLEQKFYNYPFLPTDGSKEQINNVINFEYNDLIFSFGNITYEIIEPIYFGRGMRSYKRSYHVASYMTTRLNKAAAYDITIQPITIVGSIDNVDLESSEYEKIFATYANDQILVRKLVTPKTMETLTQLAKSGRDIPTIRFQNNLCCIKFPEKKAAGFDDPIFTFGLFELTKKNEIIEEICSKVEKDILFVKNGFEWISAFNIF